MSRIAAPAAPPDFAAALMQVIWQGCHERRAGEIEQYDGVGAAVYALRAMSGMTADQLAARLSIDMYKLAQIEKKGSPVDEHDLQRMAQVAREFSMHKLAGYFERTELLFKGRPKRGRRGGVRNEP